MAILRCVALPSIIPAYSSFSSRNKGIKFYPHFSLPRSVRVSAKVSLPEPNANQTALEIMRTISEKDDCEIQDELSTLQNVCHQCKGFLGQIILVLMAKNPVLLVLSKAVASNNHFLRWSSVGASYGAFIASRECVKLFWKSQPTWTTTILLVLGYVIYKANMWNIALHQKYRCPIWTGPLAVLMFGNLFANMFLLATLIDNAASLYALIWGSIKIMISFLMVVIYLYALVKL